MLREITERRFLMSWLASLCLGVSGLFVWPFPAQDWLLQVIRTQRPDLHATLGFAYATLWFSSSFFASATVLSFVYVLVLRRDRKVSRRELPLYVPPDQQEAH